MELIIFRRLKGLCKNGGATIITITNALERGWITEAQFEECKQLINKAVASVH